MGAPAEISRSTAPPGAPRTLLQSWEEDESGSYLNRLCKGMEPEPDPKIPFFPLNNFSTRATFPVRAASSSSCSFPIPDTSLQRRGYKNPTNLPYIPSLLLPSDPSFTVWCGRASERNPITASSCCCCCAVI